MMYRLIITTFLCIFLHEIVFSQELSIKTDYRTIYKSNYIQAIDAYEVRDKNERMFNFSVRYHINKKSSFSLSYAKIVNYSLLEITDSAVPQNFLLIPNALTVNGDNIKVLSENGSDRLDSFTLTYSYHNIFNQSIVHVNPTLGVELIHTEEEQFFKDYVLFYEELTVNQTARQVGTINMDGQYHQRITPFLKPGIEFGIHPLKKSPIYFTIAVNYRFPIFWNLNDVYLNRDFIADTGGYINYRTTSINTGRAFELLIGTELSLKKLKALF